MARKLRVEYPGAIYHIMNRGDHRERIFQDDRDRMIFLDTLGEACAKTDCQIHSFSLIPNHFHMVLETPQANLVKGMKWLLGTYTGRFNRRHRLNGHLFGGRYKALRVQSAEFRRLLFSNRLRMEENHFGPERIETQEMKAERIIVEELRAGGWSSSDLAKRRKGHVVKVELALRLRRETTMTLRWIAHPHRLEMGHVSSLNSKLYWHRRTVSRTRQN